MFFAILKLRVEIFRDFLSGHETLVLSVFSKHGRSIGIPIIPVQMSCTCQCHHYSENATCSRVSHLLINNAQLTGTEIKDKLTMPVAAYYIDDNDIAIVPHNNFVDIERSPHWGNYTGNQRFSAVLKISENLNLQIKKTKKLWYF